MGRYVMKAELLPMEYYSLFAERGNYRSHHGDSVESVSGIYIVSHVHGTIRSLSMIKLLELLTASVALLALVNFIMDHVVIRMLELKHVYKTLKYQPSMHFEKLRKIRDALKLKHGENYDERKHKHAFDSSLLHDVISRDSRELD